MATKNTTDLINDADFYLPDNITEDISAGDVRQRIKDLAGSLLNIVDGGLIIQTQTGYASAITPSSDYAFSTKKYVDDLIAGISLTWGSLTGIITDQTDLITYLSTNYLTSATAATTYLKLDASNSPLTGTLTTRQIDVQSTYRITLDSAAYIGADVSNENLGFTTGNWNAGTATGGGNTGMGRLVFNALTTGTGNSGFGRSALVGVTGNNNSGFGYSSGSSITSGTNNTLSGYLSGGSLTTGTFNVILGSHTSTTLASVAGSIALGSYATLDKSNEFVVGSRQYPVYSLTVGLGNSVQTSAGQLLPFSVKHSSNPINSSNQWTYLNNTNNWNLYFDCSPARGTGLSSNVGIRYSPPIGSGTTLQSLTDAFLVWGSTGNIGLWDNTAANFGGGEQVMFIKNAVTVPTTDPTGGGILYVGAGALKYRGSSGTVTTIAVS